MKPGERIVTIQTQFDPGPDLTTATDRLTATSGAPQIDCYVANIMGADIETLDSQSKEIAKKDLYFGKALNGLPCAYPGKLSPPLTAAQLRARQMFEFSMVSSSNLRRLQVLGISDPENQFCSQPGFTRETFANSNRSEFSEFYEMGADNFALIAQETEHPITIVNRFKFQSVEDQELLRVNNALCTYTSAEIASRTDVRVSLTAEPYSASTTFTNGTCVKLTVSATPKTGAETKYLSVSTPYYEAPAAPLLAGGTWYYDPGCTTAVSPSEIDFVTRREDGTKVGLRRNFQFFASDCTSSACVKALYFKIENPAGKSKIAFRVQSNENPSENPGSVYTMRGARLLLDLE